MENSEVYHRDPDILGGAPVFCGTRVPIDSLLAYLSHGKRIEDFLDDFPSVTESQAVGLLTLAKQQLLEVA